MCNKRFYIIGDRNAINSCGRGRKWWHGRLARGVAVRRDVRPVHRSKAQERSVLRVREAIGRFARVVVWPEYRPTPRRTASTGEPPVPRKRAAPIRAAAQA